MSSKLPSFPKNFYSDKKYKSGDYEFVETAVNYSPETEPVFLIGANYVNHIFKMIEGRMLTVIDSSIGDKEQREATKSIVRQAIWDERGRINLAKLIEI